MSEIEVNKIKPASGTTVTLGESGDTFTVPSGATITNNGTATGFGASISNDANNRIITADGSGGLNGEANLTFDGTNLKNAGGVLRLQNATTGSADSDGLLIEASGNDVYFNQKENAPIYFRTNNTTRMKVGTTGEIMLGNYIGSGSGHGVEIADISNQRGQIALETTLTSAVGNIYFINGNGSVGSIVTDGSSTSYNTSSDYRLKENVADMDNAITRVKQLNPKRFNFIADSEDTLLDGFLAHEVSSVVPEAIKGTHNEVDDDGNPVYQSIDQAKLVPLLTGALQEALTEIDNLKARIEALENA